MPEIVGSLRPPRLSIAPTSPARGELYYDIDDDKLYWWNGSSWILAGAGSGATVFDTDEIGTIKAFSGATIPTNWMLADGRSLLRSAYPQLFAALGGTSSPWGLPDGNNFNIPDCRQQFILGANNSATQNLPGGASTHTLDLTQLPSHSHRADGAGGAGGATGAADRSLNRYSDAADRSLATSSGQPYISPTPGVDSGFRWGTAGTIAYQRSDVNGVDHLHHVYGIDHLHGVNANGGGGSHNNMPPYIQVAQIIKVTGATIDAGGAIVGAPGTPGEKWFSGTGSPSGTLSGSSVGDWYLDGDSGDFYEKTATTTWTLRGNISGTGIEVYEQAATPTEPIDIGSVWIDTDEAPPIWSGLVWPPPLVTLLPVSAVDGQEVYFVADAAAGVIWHLRYRTAAPGSYKWEYIGGPPLSNRFDGSTATAGGYNDLGGPTVIVPRIGEYRVQFGCRIDGSVASSWAEIGPGVAGGSPATDNVTTFFCSAANPGVHSSRSVPVLVVATDTTSGRTIKLMYVTNGSSVSFMRRWIEVTPVRVG